MPAMVSLSSALHAVSAFISKTRSKVAAWLSQPHVYPVIITWVSIFTPVLFGMLGAGFGPVGIIPGSLAAGFQGSFYGASTPAAGVFATLTSLGMLGRLAPVAVVVAASTATILTTIMWACGWFA